jgi:RNA polymerase primary sigma factor
MVAHPVLPPDEQLSLVELVQRGRQAQAKLDANGHVGRAALEAEIREGTRAMERLVLSNLRLITKLAHHYKGKGVPFEDLQQAGVIGLMRGINKFDPARFPGVRLITYATWWVRQAIQRTVADQCRTIRLPIYCNDIVVRIQRAYTELKSELGREPTQDEIAAVVKANGDMLASMTMHDLLQVAREPLSLEWQAHHDDSPFGEYLPDSRALQPAAVTINQALSNSVEHVLSTLSEREQFVLRHRFGLGDYEKLTLQEVADLLDLTRERVRQIQKEAMGRLRHPSRRRRLQGFL